jgi:hypothetical protein
MTITDTPWGQPDYQREIAPGIHIVSTPSHGGFFLDAAHNAQVPAAWRAASFNGQAEGGWYEEDCDAALAILAWPGFFDAENIAYAERMFAAHFEPRGLKRGVPCAT